MKYNLFAIFVPSRTSFLGGRVKAEARQGNTSSKTALLQQTMTATMAAAAGCFIDDDEDVDAGYEKDVDGS